MDDYSPDIDQRLWEAYLNTQYLLLPSAIGIRIGCSNPQLDELLIDNNAYCWAFLSAWNPFSTPLTPEENQRRHQQLEALLMQEKYLYCPGEGRGMEGNWPPEASFFVLNLPRSEALRIGRQFEQHAIVWGSITQLPKLCACF